MHLIGQVGANGLFHIDISDLGRFTELSIQKILPKCPFFRVERAPHGVKVLIPLSPDEGRTWGFLLVLGIEHTVTNSNRKYAIEAGGSAFEPNNDDRNVNGFSFQANISIKF